MRTLAGSMNLGGEMTEQKANPNDWNRDYTVGTGRSPIMFWLGMIALVIFFGGMALSYLLDWL